MKIAKSKWYLTRIKEDRTKRVVMVEFGGFTSMAKADAYTWQPDQNGNGLMERKPLFEGMAVLPVKGERIIAHPKQYE